MVQEFARQDEGEKAAVTALKMYNWEVATSATALVEEERENVCSYCLRWSEQT